MGALESSPKVSYAVSTARDIGYLGAVARRREVWLDADGRAVLKADHSPRELARRRREALGRVAQEGSAVDAAFEPTEAAPP